MSSSGSSTPTRRGQTGRDLYKAIFESDFPEQFIRTIPAQSLYFVVKQRGLQSSGELIEIATIEQCRLLLDFDLWEKDQFREDNFWEWLSLSDEEDPLKFTQKLLKSIDLKLISMVTARYVEVKVFDEANDTPPGPGWYTPDKGFTWINVHVEDGTRHFLLNRLLALIFETSAELFYQLLSIPGVSSASSLEEESYQDRSKRLAAEGFPEFVVTEEINSSLLPFEAKKIIEEGKQHPIVSDIPIVEPLLYDSFLRMEPLTSAMATAKDFESLEAELVMVLNASLEFFNIPLYEYDAVMRHTQRVKGSINIGLEKACLMTGATPGAALACLGIAKLYRLGLHELRALRKDALKISFDEAKLLTEDQQKFSLVAHTRQPFPEIPEFYSTMDTQGSTETHASPHTKAIQSLKEIEVLRAQLGEIALQK